MASFSFARPSQPTPAQPNNGSVISFASARSTSGLSPNDPLQPLRAMAERVGKEVEKFAERVDHWHTHGNDSARAKYQTTVKMVGKFRDVAELQVRELKRASDAENKGELKKSVRRRIQNMADAPEAQSVFAPALTEPTKNVQELRQWQAELATWELLRIIIDHHHPEPEVDVAAEKQTRLANVGGTARYSPNSEIWDRFLVEDSFAKEKEVVLRWLEQTAQSSEGDMESITSELEAQSGKGAHTWTSGWLDTKSKIKQAKRMEGTDQPLKPDIATLKTTDRTQNLATQLDPDGPARQKRALEKSDEFYERALWMVCYEMMRRGVPWNEISDWCQERNEAWRGVSVGAAYESHPKKGPNVAGQTVGFLFRRMCFYAARGARIPYEGAVYGLLSGDLKQVQAVCRSWDDHLYAHYNALLLSRFDTYLQQKYPDRVTQSLSQKFAFQDAVANIGDWEGSSRKVVELLKQQKATASQAVSPIKLIQSALISRNVDELVFKVGAALADMMQEDDRPGNLMVHPDSSASKPGPKPAGGERTIVAERWYQTLASDPHAFRILVHICIALQNGLFTLSAKSAPHMAALENVVVGYIEFLRITKRMQLIPLYAAQLQEERAYHCLARVLPDIKNTEEQRRCVALLKQYQVDPVEVVAGNFMAAFENCGYTQYKGAFVINKSIKRFEIVEGTSHEQYLWPGIRIKEQFEGSAIEPKEEAVIEALLWYNYIEHEFEQTFESLKNALMIFLLNGRLGAAEKVVAELSVESLSLSRTEALCGYPFDFTQQGTEEQDESLMRAFRDSLSTTARGHVGWVEQMPKAEGHAYIVMSLREKSSQYYELQQMVRLLAMFREWREEEDKLMKLRREAQGPKPNTKRIKELLDTIQALFNALMTSLGEEASTEVADTEDMGDVKRAYVPEIVLGYLSILQTASYFIHRDCAIKAMEIATLVADEDNEWLQKLFLQSGRMSELVDTLALVSRSMLKLSEHEGKKGPVKKRGSKGETLRIWDLNAADRV